MRSRLDVHEELDIRCGQLSCRHSINPYWWESYTIMTKVKLCCTLMTALVIVTNLPNTKSSEINKIIYNTNGLESYSFEYETSDGVYRREDGGINSDSKGLVVRGEYGYIDSGGHHYSVRYIADVNGFQPQIYSDDTRFNDRRII